MPGRGVGVPWQRRPALICVSWPITRRSAVAVTAGLDLRRRPGGMGCVSTLEGASNRGPRSLCRF